MGMIVGRFAHVAQLLEDVRVVRRHEIVRLSDENSRGRVQNVRGGSLALPL
jgi:hypothetical protein